MKKTMKKYFPIARLIFYFIFFLFFILVLISHFQESNCFTYVHLNYLCPTCGVTRAFISLLDFNFIDAFNFNTVFTLAIGPICIFIFLQDAYCIIYRMITHKEK